MFKCNIHSLGVSMLLQIKLEHSSRKNTRGTKVNWEWNKMKLNTRLYAEWIAIHVNDYE